MRRENAAPRRHRRPDAVANKLTSSRSPEDIMEFTNITAIVHSGVLVKVEQLAMCDDAGEDALRWEPKA